MNFELIALQNAEDYPLMEAGDFVKLAYQSAFGCGHMVKDFETALERIKAERGDEKSGVYAQPIGNGYYRLHLSGGEYPLSNEAIARMFVLSAEAASGNRDLFLKCAETLSSLARKGKIAPSPSEIDQALAKFKAGDYAPVSHTQAYREAYRPAYRVVKEKFAKHLPLISKLESLKHRKSGAIVAIDGMCASGKTTLANLLSSVLNAPVYHMDDFFLPPEKRTQARLNEIGGNVDYERFRTDVLDPLLSRKPFSFRPFDCSVMDFSVPVACAPAPINIVEGSYACHPTLVKDYDFTVFLSIDPDLQLSRIQNRNGEKMLLRFKNEWIPMEMRYFEALDLRNRADYTLSVQK